jgi:cystathionine gamma-synthase
MTYWTTFILYGFGTEEELDILERRLVAGDRIRALFCELASNPLLASPNLPRIRALADRYQFVVVCDETIGTFVNVCVTPYVDIILTSLTKMFSGVANVMGGR